MNKERKKIKFTDRTNFFCIKMCKCLGAAKKIQKKNEKPP